MKPSASPMTTNTAAETSVLEKARERLILTARRHTHMRRVALRMSELSETGILLADESLETLDEELDRAVSALESLLTRR